MTRTTPEPIPAVAIDTAVEAIRALHAELGNDRAAILSRMNGMLASAEDAGFDRDEWLCAVRARLQSRRPAPAPRRPVTAPESRERTYRAAVAICDELETIPGFCTPRHGDDDNRDIMRSTVRKHLPAGVPFNIVARAAQTEWMARRYVAQQRARAALAARDERRHDVFRTLFPGACDA